MLPLVGGGRLLGEGCLGNLGTLASPRLPLAAAFERGFRGRQGLRRKPGLQVMRPDRVLALF